MFKLEDFKQFENKKITVYFATHSAHGVLQPLADNHTNIVLKNNHFGILYKINIDSIDAFYIDI